MQCNNKCCFPIVLCKWKGCWLIDSRLSIMIGGDVGLVEALRPLFEAMGKNIRHMGPSGQLLMNLHILNIFHYIYLKNTTLSTCDWGQWLINQLFSFTLVQKVQNHKKEPPSRALHYWCVDLHNSKHSFSNVVNVIQTQFLNFWNFQVLDSRLKWEIKSWSAPQWLA